MQGPCQGVATGVELFSSEYTHRDLKGGCYLIRTRSGASRCFLVVSIYPWYRPSGGVRRWNQH